MFGDTYFSWKLSGADKVSGENLVLGTLPWSMKGAQLIFIKIMEDQ